LGLPHPFSSRQVCPPTLWYGGEHTRLRLKGWGSPNSNEGTYTVVLYIYKYFVTLPLTPFSVVSISPVFFKTIPPHFLFSIPHFNSIFKIFPCLSLFIHCLMFKVKHKKLNMVINEDIKQF
jgi:hypothetical protein